MAVQKSKVTIFDVAKASGVSSSAVSYALNGKSGVSEDTRAKVLKIAHELGWKPNGAAQALAKSKTQRIGLVLGYDPWALGMQMHQVDVEPLLDKMGIEYDPAAKYLGMNGKYIGQPASAIVNCGSQDTVYNIKQ